MNEVKRRKDKSKWQVVTIRYIYTIGYLDITLYLYTIQRYERLKSTKCTDEIISLVYLFYRQRNQNTQTYTKNYGNFIFSLTYLYHWLICFEIYCKLHMYYEIDPTKFPVWRQRRDWEYLVSARSICFFIV
jgi:hypothetical protein